MTQASKKSSAGQSAARLTSNMASKAARGTYAAMESGRNSAENVVRLGGNAMRDFISSSASEAQKVQDKALAMSRENAEQFAKSADAMTKMMYEMIGISRDNIETCVECGNTAAAMAKDVNTELFECANRTFSEGVEMSKEFFACRTFNDMFELQNRMVSRSIDSFFNESTKLSGMMFEYAGEAMEPINERVAEAAEKFGKAISA